MKSGTKKISKTSSNTRWKQFRDFLSKPVSLKSSRLINEEELEIFSLLVESGLPFSDAVELSFKESDTILRQLSSGTSFGQIALHQKDGKTRTLGRLCSIFSLTEALAVHKKLQASQKALMDKLVQPCLYPLVIMAFSTVLVWIFSEAIMPMMSMGTSSELPILSLLKIICALFWVLALIVTIALGAMLVIPDRLSGLSFLFFLFPVMKTLTCLQCASLFEALSQRDLSTRESLELMSDGKSFPFCAMLVNQWTRKLKRGKSMQSILESDPRLDPSFVRLFVLGMQSQSLSRMMGVYQKNALMKLEKSAKKFSKSVLLVAYGFVGILALSVYQMMLEPLSMLESF